MGRPFAVASYRSRDVDAVELATAVARIREARYVMAGPGSPSYALRQWAGGPIPDALAGKITDGGILTMASAAALTLGTVAIPVYEIYKVGEDPRWLDGLDLLGRVTGLRAAVVPHYDNAEGGTHDTRFCYIGERRLRTLEGMLPAGAFILGVDSQRPSFSTSNAASPRCRDSAVSRSGWVVAAPSSRAAARCRSTRWPRSPRTRGRAHRRHRLGAGRGRRSPRSGDDGDAGRAAGSSVRDDMVRDEGTFVDALGRGDTRTAVGALLDLDSAISARLRAGEDSPDLDNASATFQALIARLGEQAADGTRDPRATLEPLVTTLLDLRARARDAQDWESADFIRDRLVAAGIEIHDAAEGSTWTLGDPLSE